jgi:mitochondrial distribution and morphology protein 10
MLFSLSELLATKPFSTSQSPEALHFSISKSSNSLFNTTYSINALTSLNGTIGCIFTSHGVRFKDMVDRFKVYDNLED